MNARARRGFGLTEILIAIALFSTAFLYLLGTLTASNHAIRQSGDILVAQDVAERVLEDYKGRTYAATNSTAANATWDVSYNNNGNNVLLGFQYSVDVQEAPLAAPFAARKMKTITVNVEWRNRYMERLAAGTPQRVRRVVLQTSVGQP